MRKLSVILLLSSLVCFVACKKDDPKPADPKDPITQEQAIEALKEFAQTSGQFDATVKEGGNIADKGIIGEKSSKGDGYPDISGELQGDGKWLVTCDYGPELMLCEDGYWRRGIVRVLTTGFFITPGTEMIMTFEDFYQKGEWGLYEYKIDGTQVITNVGPNSEHSEMTDYTVTVTDGMITYNGKEVNYTEATTRTLLPNSELCENKWYITGEWNGVSSSDVPYTLTANSTPLYYKVCCHFFQDGILNVDVEGLPPFSINYGYTEDESDECDQYAEIIYQGYSFPFKM
jgi:hypothetical protein